MKDEDKTLLVLNPAAGKGKGKRHFAEIHRRLREKYANLHVETSTGVADLVDIGRNAAAESIDRLITIGGDGTPFLLLNGYLSARNRGDGTPLPKIGMIPAGTGNSFLRDFDDCDYAGWVEHLLTGDARPVDLVEMNYREGDRRVRKYFLNIVGVGVIADVLKLTNEKLKPFGAMGYSMAVLIRLVSGIFNSLELTVDDRRIGLKNSAMVISNSKFTGGAMKIAPMADAGDGKVDVVIFDGVNRRDILSIFSRIFKGTHVDHPRVTIHSGACIRVEGTPQQRLMADGELLGWTPLTMKVLPGALPLLAP